MKRIENAIRIRLEYCTQMEFNIDYSKTNENMIDKSLKQQQPYHSK